MFSAFLVVTALHAFPQDLLPDNIQYSGATLNIKKYAQFPNFSQKLISMATRPDDDALYVTSQEGRIYRVTENTDGIGDLQEWFNIDKKVDFNGRQTSAHGGLRNTSFHPDFANPGTHGYGKFYTSQMIRSNNNAHFIGSSQRGNGIAHDSTVSEWTYDFNQARVNPESYRELFRVKMPVFDHPVKQMTFNQYAKPGDEDYGLLYIAHGDASNQSATFGGGENLDDGLGKILRIDPVQRGFIRYSTPGNPFTENPSALNEIYAYGLRNPHHISFSLDSSGESHLVTADVGRDNVDEVNIVKSGKNYGWSTREGTFAHTQYQQNVGQEGYINGVTALPSNEAEKGFTYPAVQMDHNSWPGANIIGFAIAGGFAVDIEGAPEGKNKNQYVLGNFGNEGALFHVSLDEMATQITDLDPNVPEQDSPEDLTWLYPDLLKIHYDHDNNPNTTAKIFNNFVGLLQSDGVNTGRSDFRFGQGVNGELFITSKQSGALYVVTNATASVPEPSLWAALLSTGCVFIARRHGRLSPEAATLIFSHAHDI